MGRPGVNSQILLDRLEGRPTQAEQLSFEELMAVETKPIPSRTRRRAPAQRAAKPVSGRHQDVRLYLTVMLKTFVELTDAGLVRDAPFEVQFGQGVVYQPDIVFIANSNFDRVHDTYIEGPPDIILEIVSLDSTALDRGEKFAVYEQHGVREYWLIDPLRELVDLYHLGPDGYYDEYRPDIGGRLRSRVLKGFTLEIDLLWKRILPTTTEIVEMAQAMVGQH